MVWFYRAQLCYLTELFYLLVYGMVLLYRAHLCHLTELFFLLVYDMVLQGPPLLSNRAVLSAGLWYGSIIQGPPLLSNRAVLSAGLWYGSIIQGPPLLADWAKFGQFIRGSLQGVYFKLQDQFGWPEDRISSERKRERGGGSSPYISLLFFLTFGFYFPYCFCLSLIKRNSTSLQLLMYKFLF